MEEWQKRHIANNLFELVSLTSCNTTCTSILMQYGVFSEDDKAKLDSIPNELIKTKTFYDLLMTKKNTYALLKTALEESCQSGALRTLKQLEKEDFTSLGKEKRQLQSHPASTPNWRKSRNAAIRFDVLSPVFNFTGRERQLLELHRKLQENDGKRAGISQMVSIVGLGGIGKTELARKYVQEYGECYDGNVIWMSAQTEEILYESFRRLAKDYLHISLLNPNGKEIDITTIVDQIYSHFNEQRVLFIFDNAANTRQLQEFMPFRLSSSTSFPYVVITSRDREWGFNVPVLELNEMTKEEAIHFVKSSLEVHDDDDNEVFRLVNRLHCYPLALSQAVSFIKQRNLVRNFNIRQYLTTFEENSEKLLNAKTPLIQYNSYGETTLTTWRLATQQISDAENGTLAMTILNAIAYFLPDKIPMSMFSSLPDGDDYEEAISLLVKYSMLNVQRGEKNINVPRLVQEVTRIQLKRKNEEKESLKTALLLVFPNKILNCDEDTVYHALSAYKFSCGLSPELSIEFKQLPWQILSVLNSYNRHEEIKAVGMELEAILNKLLSPEDSDVIRLKLMMADAAFILQDNLEANFKELEQLLQRVVENRDSSFELYDRLRVESLLANYLKKLGSYQEALELSRSTIERHKSLYGLNHWQTINNLVNIVTCIWKLRASATPSSLSVEDISLFQQANEEELNSAISVFKDAHQTNLELLGNDVNWTNTMVCVADCLEDSCDTEYATKILNDVFQRTTNSSDRRFFRIAINCMNLLIFLAHTKNSEGKNEEALAIAKNVQSGLANLRRKNEKESVPGRVLMINELEAALATLHVCSEGSEASALDSELKKDSHWRPVQHSGIVSASAASSVTTFEHKEVEERQKDYIFRNLSTLVRKTRVYTSCLAMLVADGVFRADDVEQLDSMSSNVTKAYRFYELIVTRPHFFRHLITVLTETCQTGAVNILQGFDKEGYSRDVGKAGTITLGPIRYDVRVPVRFFTGRIEELQNLHRKLQQSDSKMVVIAGLGGIGKTELARSYIKRYGDEYDNNLIWISAESEETLTHSFRALAKNKLKLNILDFDGKAKPITSIVAEVYNYFHGRRSLFVLDDVGSYEYIEKFIPSQTSDKPYLLITSRDRDCSFGVEILQVHEMEEREAIDFVKKGLQIHDDDDSQCESIIKLVNRFQCFPLALSQAIFFINQRQHLENFSISQYIEKLEKNSEMLLNSKISQIESNAYSKTTLTTWKKTTDLICENEHVGRQAMWMLNTISYFLSGNIPIQFLVSNGTGRNEFEIDRQQIEEALKLLVKYSMVNTQPSKKTISVHRLVQEVTRIQLRKNKTEEVGILRTALKKLSANIDSDTSGHACSVYKYCAPYKTLVDEFKEIACKILGTFYPNKVSQLTLNIAADLRKVLQEHFPPEDVNLLRFEARVADIEFELGGFERGHKILEKIVPFYAENEAGSFSRSEIIHIQQQYALFLKEMGRGTESLSLLLKSFQKLKTLRGLNDFDTIKALVDITNCLDELGHFRKEPPVNAKYLQLLRINFDVTKPEKIVWTFHTAFEANKHLIAYESNYANLFFGVAECLYKLGEKNIAVYIAREIYEAGKNSEDSAIQTNSMICLNLIANLKREEGKDEEALALYQEAHTLLERKLGKSNLHTLTVKGNALMTRGNLGQAEAALEGLQDVLETMRRNHPDNHETVYLELNMAALLFKIGKYNDSLELLVGIRAKLQENFPQLEMLMLEVNSGIEKVQKSALSSLSLESLELVSSHISDDDEDDGLSGC